MAETPTANSLSDTERDVLKFGVTIVLGIVVVVVLVLGHYAIEANAFPVIYGVALSIMGCIIIAEFTSSLRRKILVALIDGLFLVLLFPIYFVLTYSEGGADFGTSNSHY